MLVASTGCAASPVMRAAEEGRYQGLREQLAADLAAGHLHLSDAASFAKVVATGEIERASGEEGAQRLHELRSCAHDLEDPLERRAKQRDTLGAAAAIVLLDAGLISAGGYRRYLTAAPDAPEVAWRALGARALTDSDDGELRRRMIADADQQVRRSALRAAVVAGDPADTEPVLDAARVDPWAPARAQAIRAAGVIGGERAVLALKDLWPRADEAVKESIVDAWASRRSWNGGGRREVRWVSETQHGKPAIHATIALLRAGEVEAIGTLERAIKDGPADDRVEAIELVPLKVRALREAVQAAESDPDEGVATAAQVRRFEAVHEEGGPVPGSPAWEELAAKLLTVAGGTGTGSVAARGALARAHDKRLLPVLERDGASKDAKLRAEAGTALAVLGDLPRAAVVAADMEPKVRTAVSCAILRAWATR